MPRSIWTGLILILILVVGACQESTPRISADAGAPDRLSERLTVVAAHVDEWREATTLAEAQAAAEAAANHVTGPDGSGFGDRDGDGEVRGPSDEGILPAIDGDPGGFALAAVKAGAPSCIETDILGGSWADPGERWAILDRAVAEWSGDNNPFPGLPSHAQRIVGWARLTMEATTLQEAQVFGGHAKIHVDVSLRALNDCGG